MPVEVIGAGMGRTGTMSLQKALDILLAPGKCYHFGSIFTEGHIEVWQPELEKRSSPDWETILEKCGYVATLDHPCADFYEELMKRYPNAKVLLSEHPGGPERWYASKMALGRLQTHMSAWPIKPVAILLQPIIMPMFFKNPMNAKYKGKPQLGRKLGEVVETFVWGEDHLSKKADKAYAMKRYEDWNAKVKATVPKDRLLVFNVKQGWAPLCEFLGKPVPDVPFPREDSHNTESIDKLFFKVKVVLWVIYAGAAAGLVWGAATVVGR